MLLVALQVCPDVHTAIAASVVPHLHGYAELTPPVRLEHTSWILLPYSNGLRARIANIYTHIYNRYDDMQDKVDRLERMNKAELLARKVRQLQLHQSTQEPVVMERGDSWKN